MADMTRRYPYVGFKAFGVEGAATVTDITVTGVATTDTLVAVFRAGATAGVIKAVTGETSITAADTIQLSTTVTTGGYVFGFYVDSSLA